MSRTNEVDFFRHNIGEAEIQELVRTLRTKYIALGPTTKEFEREFSDYLGVKYAFGLTSCTMALFIALKAAGVGPGDEVITCPLTFVSTLNAILYCGARPVLVDSEQTTGNINCELIENKLKPVTKAIIPIHLYGHMADMKAIRQIADTASLAVIEDAAHCIEGVRDGVRPGQLSEAACFSFYATKNITCGDGGAVVTNHRAMAEKLAKLRFHGMDKSAEHRYTKRYQHWDMPILGYKCNMTDIQAALLLGQLRNIESNLNRKEEITQIYTEAFSGMKEVRFPVTLPSTKHARHLFTIWVDPNIRDRVIWHLQEEGVGIAVNFRPVHLMLYYKKTLGHDRGDFPVAERIGDSTISLPLYSIMTDDDVNFVIGKVKKVVGNLSSGK